MGVIVGVFVTSTVCGVPINAVVAGGGFVGVTSLVVVFSLNDVVVVEIPSNSGVPGLLAGGADASAVTPVDSALGLLVCVWGVCQTGLQWTAPPMVVQTHVSEDCGGGCLWVAPLATLPVVLTVTPSRIA